MRSAEIISVVCALVAAAFAFWSASISLPQRRLSIIAALFAAVSAIAGAFVLYLLR